MAHVQQQSFVAAIKAAFPEFFSGSRVLEIGSLDVNGSIRQQFSGGDYIGIDVGEGPGVDVVSQGQDYDAPDGSFDVVVCCEAMEHNPFWRETFNNILRLCRPGGLIVMTCASTGRPEHGTSRTTPGAAPLVPWDYYRNLEAKDFRRSIDLDRHLVRWGFFSDLSSCDLYFVGFKMGATVPDGAAAVFAALRRRYWAKNLRNGRGLRRRLFIALVGEQRFQNVSTWRKRLHIRLVGEERYKRAASLRKSRKRQGV
jgi:SAM-dependent methyltransferase